MIDLLKIEIPQEYRGNLLSTIEISDDSVAQVGSMNPAINLIGLTVVGQEEPKKNSQNKRQR